MTKTKYCYRAFGVDYYVTLDKGQYENGRLALRLVDNEGVVAKVTVNLPEIILRPNEIIVKCYGENEPMLGFLMANGLIHCLARTVYAGGNPWAACVVAELTQAACEALGL